MTTVEFVAHAMRARKLQTRLGPYTDEDLARAAISALASCLSVEARREIGDAVNADRFPIPKEAQP